MQLKSLIAVPLVALALTGCSSPAQNTQPAEINTVEKPLFASDEEALAAAQTAYAHYLEVSDQIARDGGDNPERLKPMLSAEQYRLEITSFETYVSKEIHSSGQMNFDTLHIAQSGENDVSVYLCLDSSQSRLIDKSGKDVTPSGRIDRWPLLVSFKSLDGSLIISGSETWSGTNFC
ncbi:MAG: hypothetical protein RL720_316 [Actinomycetota bacterium]|jgi:hypothetical protein